MASIVSVQAHVDYLDTLFSPRMEFLSQSWLINHMDNGIELIQLRENIELDLATRSAVLRHIADVVIDITVVLHVILVQFLILIHVLNCLLSQSFVQSHIAQYLICHCFEKAITLVPCFYNFEVEFS